MKSSSQTTSTKCQYQATPSKPKWWSGVKWPGDAAEQDHDQHDRADRHVKAVEAGQHEERRAVGAVVSLRLSSL